MGSIMLREREVTSLLHAAAGIDSARPLRVEDVLDLLGQFVRSDVLFWNWVRLVPQFREQALVDATTTQPVERAPLEGWLRHLPEHPIMSGRNGPVVAVSDVVGDRELERTWLYQQAMAPSGIRHEIGMELGHRRDEMSVVVFSRGPGRDFDERDHVILRLLRPHVDSAVRRLTLPPPDLTAREREVMLLVREGLTDGQVARRLGVAEATVSKHLEHVYSRTGARSRVQAVELCRPALDGLPARRGALTGSRAPAASPNAPPRCR